MDLETPKRATSIPKDLAAAAGPTPSKLSQLQRPASKEKLADKTSPGNDAKSKKAPAKQEPEVSKVTNIHKFYIFNYIVMAVILFKCIKLYFTKFSENKSESIKICCINIYLTITIFNKYNIKNLFVVVVVTFIKYDI